MMKAFPAINYGVIVGAYWAPENCGFDVADRASVYMDAKSGKTTAFKFVERKRTRWVDNREIETVVGIDKFVDHDRIVEAEVIEALQQCIIEAMLARQKATKTPVGF